MDQPNKLILVEVVYATPTKQHIFKLEIPAGSSILTTILASGFPAMFSEIDITKQKIGIFGKHKLLSDVVQTGDRIEIYRPLIIDPKELRRKKALKSKTLKGKK